VLDLDNSELFKDKSEDAVNMDKVFKNIIDIYDDKMIRVVYNMMLLMEENKNSQQVVDSYLVALQYFMVPINEKIRSWIQENLVM
jgi:LPS O-antigen subunit length determinant protein (WzzB/FepE family)